MLKTKNGFTLVELLIVIVIIAILAAISIVAYNGIQDRARNTAKIQAAQEIVKHLNLAVIANDVNFGSGAPYCIPGTGIDTDGDGTKDCTASGTKRTEKSTVNDMFSGAQVTGLSFPTDVLKGSSGTDYRGVQVTYGSGAYGVEGKHQPYFVYFALKGASQDCVSGYSIGPNVGNDNTASPLTAYVHRSFYSTGDGVTICAFTINQPASYN